MCLRVPVGVVALNDDFFVRFRANETERPRPNGMTADLVSTAVRDNSNGTVRNIPQQSGEWFFEMKHNGGIVGRVKGSTEPIRGCLGTTNLSLQQRIESPLHIARGKRTAIVKLHALVQVKYVSKRIGNVPTLG